MRIYSYNRVVLALLLAMLTCAAFAQREKITAEETYIAHDDETPNQAKQKVLDRAILKGLAAKYGTYMSQEGTTLRENVKGVSNVNVHQLTYSMVKGENLGVVGRPAYSESIEDGLRVYHVKVTFWAREITSAAVDFNAKILKHGTTDNCEDDDFKSGDELYLSFSAPTKGYLAVYLVEGETAYCLLPYRHQTDGICKVDANKRYVFFSEANAPDGNRGVVDEYMMTTEKEVESNIIYVMFSPEEFSKPGDTQSDRKVNLAGTDGLPRELPYDKFLEWKSRLQGSNRKVKAKSIPITIRK